MPPFTTNDAVAVGDLNGDGKSDLVATSSDNLFVFFQDSILLGTFLPAITYVAGPRASSVVIHDIDGDGLPDLVIVNAGDPTDGANSSISIRLQNPDSPGNFLPATNYASANGSRSVAVGALNGDGSPDLAVAAVGYSSQSPGVAQVFLQNNGLPGTFLMPQSYGAGHTTQSIGIEDLNGDEKPDLASNDGPIVLIQNPSQPGIFVGGIVLPVH
ncbi:MAG: VCBS repeat-containing protein [Deltaproteobacteria bacterium]|nr:VCBS repeat-containing protein [Deltaproteobacteria bacterium]